MDVDGTLTDGKIYMSDLGECCKAFHVKDGYGIREILSSNHMIPVIITGRESQIVENRCRELGISEIYQGVYDKLYVLKKVTANLKEVAYIGDDLNDLSCMKAVKKAGGMVGCPADAVKEVSKVADFTTKHNGGDGAVREFIEWLIDCTSF